MVAVENMNRGKLVIASDIGSMQEVIGDTGLSFVPGDADGLARCMSRVLDDERLPAVVGHRASGPLVSEEFELGKMVAQHLEVYRSVLEHR